MPRYLSSCVTRRKSRVSNPLLRFWRCIRTYRTNGLKSARRSTGHNNKDRPHSVRLVLVTLFPCDVCSVPVIAGSQSGHQGLHGLTLGACDDVADLHPQMNRLVSSSTGTRITSCFIVRTRVLRLRKTFYTLSIPFNARGRWACQTAPAPGGDCYQAIVPSQTPLLVISYSA